jgi:predicted component of type VI protein secretion system
MTRHSDSVEAQEANLDTWGAVYGAMHLEVQFPADELHELFLSVQRGDAEQLQQALGNLTGRATQEVVQDAGVVLASMLAACCAWVDSQSGPEAADEMLAHLRDRLQRTT